MPVFATSLFIYLCRLFFDLSGYIVVIGYPSEWLTVALILLAEFTLSFVIYFCFLVRTSFFYKSTFALQEEGLRISGHFNLAQ